jgi:hypothetical protein
MQEDSVVNATLVSDLFITHSHQFYEVPITGVDINLKNKQKQKKKT